MSVRIMYFCKKCKYYHYANSKIFHRHRHYLLLKEKPINVLYEGIR